ncbi:broad substrate specificity ATP-binding cassette transporter ABCG2 [Phascolarctos cinereus]|uniref:Broad substrate specificity ATP-binding cassette transporter ABCG2 n=1 Tax=Phascolarctos cinereus TaxID=38626 RepID=A0A6P5KEL2_PHACI|nr:ATP-binding cassette sub-family G member 2 [Phascolarctos cinereus]XP_020843972.1 ATP-binding cassette sub-family G member 2 [Phascolarctos cinereus]XP_020843973.1 ATP-binding cassette sub-family G member 2 [Phascolarctos cinereus]XP_020843974.1 ATP-binding cassette sub-family G member 2 [Phascolarctos cinereus]XP_020843975.1 ATP-binding cassette sub-family G member 2 [Phascolarctos cinereus]XP_020843976.1 ATP-binding cassette sub-family G member 2 [Phascolarctos cinereus]XP_020843977.1 AT
MSVAEVQVIVPMSQTNSSGSGTFTGTKKQPAISVLSFHNICYQVKVKTGFIGNRKIVEKEILKNVNGIMKPGLNAILGPTGGGKSSLLDVLAARKDPHGLSGHVLINGAPQPADFKCHSGYVVQDDVVMGTLTVRENLQFSAALRLPTSMRNREKNERINRILKELGLEKVADSRVGTPFSRGVSGGERKRTSIGMELIPDPSILFLDEPTTGLDASTANAVLLLLKRMSKQGRTIIFSIHQPRYSIFKLFDSLTLLASGKLIYHGPAQKALEYFASSGHHCEPYNNPTDFFLDVINGDSSAVRLNREEGTDEAKNIEEPSQHKPIIDELIETYMNSTYFKDLKEELSTFSVGIQKSKMTHFRETSYVTSFCHQLKWLCKRSFKNLVRSPQASIAQVIITTVLGLVVGAIFFGLPNDSTGIQNRVGALFFLVNNQCFGSLSALELLVVEKKLFIHEYVSGYYRISPYFFSKLLSDLIPMRTMPSIIFTCITYFMLGLKPEAGAFFIMMFTLMLVSYTASSMALAIAAGQTVVSVANICMTVSFIFMMIFSGLLVNLTTIADWLAWLKYFSIPRYGFTALQHNEFLGLNFCPNINSTVESDDCEYAVCSGEDYLKNQGINLSPWGLWENHVALACMMIIFLVIAYLQLLFIKKFT